MEWTESQITREFNALWNENSSHIVRLRIRRLLTEMDNEASDSASTGTYLPEPYNQSKLIIRQLIGDVVDTIQSYQTRIATNEPQVTVLPLSMTARQVGKRVEENAAEQERLLMATWQKLNGRWAQQQIARSQAWGRVGWYLTLPRDATWGLPDREFFEDLTDDQIDEMKRTGRISVDDVDDEGRFIETAESWLERRREAQKGNAVSGPGLVTLQALPPDMVLARYDNDGSAKRALKFGFTYEEVPDSEFAPGTPWARSAAKLAGIDDEEDVDKYGLYLNKKGQIEGGVNVGSEPWAMRGSKRWTLIRFLTRTEIYYVISSGPNAGDGQIVYHDEHGADKVPLIAAPGLITDSGKPGGEYSSPMEGVFAASPIINQIETLLSNVATWNALGRFVVESNDGTLLADENGNPLVVSSADLIGGQPGKVEIVKGNVKQLVIDASLLFQLLDFYTARLDRSKPSEVNDGQAGASAAAWQVSQLLEASAEGLNQTVDNHADAVREVMQLWIRWFRMLDEPLYVVAAPGKRGKDSNLRGLIEFKPEDLTDAITVVQSSTSPRQKIVEQQAGIELRKEGVINDREFYEVYMHKADPEAAEVDALAQQLVNLSLTGNTDNVQPGSLLFDMYSAVRGAATMQLLDRSPNFVLATAEQMAAQETAATEAIPPPNAGSGNVANATGTVQPGQGMPLQQGGTPETQSPARVAPR